MTKKPCDLCGILITKENTENYIHADKKFGVCSSCRETLRENKTHALWLTGNKCASCGMPFGLELSVGKRTVVGPVEVKYGGRKYTVCELCAQIIEEEKKNGVTKVLKKIDKAIDEYKEIGNLARDKIIALEEMKFATAVYHLQKGRTEGEKND